MDKPLETNGFEDLDSFDDQQSSQSTSNQSIATTQSQGENIGPKQPVAPKETRNKKSAGKSTSSESSSKTQMGEPETSSRSVSDGDDNVNLNLDLEEFIPEDEDVDFEQYAEQIKETAQKGVQENLKQQVENASKPSEIDLKGLKQDLTEEIRETASDVGSSESGEIGREQENAEDEDSQDNEEKGSNAEDTEETSEDTEEAPNEADDEEDILDSKVSRPSPPAAESVRRYDATTDALYIQKTACKRLVEDVKGVQSNLDIFQERLSKIDTDSEPAKEAKSLMGKVQRKLLDLENNLFEEDTV